MPVPRWLRSGIKEQDPGVVHLYLASDLHGLSTRLNRGGLFVLKEGGDIYVGQDWERLVCHRKNNRLDEALHSFQALVS